MQPAPGCLDNLRAMVSPGHDPFVNGKTVWATIERRLARDIGAGRYRAGMQLATEHELARRFRVNRHTVRQALGSLAAKGLVRVERGRGTFVSEFAVDYVLGRRTRFAENLAAAGYVGRHRVVSARILAAPAEVRAPLALAHGARVVRLVTVGETRGRPLVAGEHFFPARRFKGLPELVAASGSISKALAALGCADYLRRKSAISARLPEPEAARLLAQPPGRPVLYVESVNVDTAGKPVEFARTCFAGDLVQLVVEPGG